MKFSNKKTYILSILTTSLLFTGCAVQNSVTPDSSSKTHNIQTISKQDLIQKAENLDLDAMIKLASDYEYQYTKEGLANFEKWYTKLDKNQNGEKLTQLAKVYGHSDHIFTNPILKTSNIYKLAQQAGNKNAKIDLIAFYLDKYRSLKAKEIHNEFIKTASKEQLIKLLDLYTKKRRNTLREEVAKKLSTDEQLQSVEYVAYQLKRYSYKKPEIEKKKEEITKKLFESNDLELLSKIAKALNTYSNKKISYKLYNEILKIDSNNTEAQYQLAKIYQRGSYYGKIKRDKVKALDYFQKAAKGGKLEAKMELLKTYSSKKEDLNKYIELKKDIEKTTEGQLALADYFFNISDSYSANKILSKLSAQGNIDSKIKQILVAKTNYRYKRNPEFTVLANKLQDEILKGNNELHKKKLIDTMSSKKYSRTFQDDLKKYYEENPQKMNIKDIRPLTKGYKVPKEERLKWTNKLIDMGDIHTTYSLANDYRSTYGLVGKDYKKRKELLEILSKKGHHAATISLAREYMYPNKKTDKDEEKALSLYEKVANEGNIDAQEFLARHYLCAPCNKDKKTHYKKAYYWTQKLAQNGSHRHMYSMGWIYQYGKGVEVDYKKAAFWYEQLVGKHSDATNNLGTLYIDGKGVEKNEKKAFELYEKAAKMNNRYSQYNLGDMYRKGIYVKKDINKAKEYFEKSRIKIANEALKELKEQGL